MAKKAKGLMWVGDGLNVIPGVPTRDLSADEAALYRDIIEATQQNTGQVFYVAVDPEPTGKEESDG